MGAQDPAGDLGVHHVQRRAGRSTGPGLPGGFHHPQVPPRAIDDLHAWLVEQGDWVALGAADEKKAAAPGTVEAWGRSPDNPVGGWYGLRNGYRGRFGMYLPPLLEALGLAEVTHERPQQPDASDMRAQHSDGRVPRPTRRRERWRRR